MCTATIVDTNVLWKVAPKREDRGDPVLRTWIRARHGTLVYCRSGKYFQELSHSPRTLRLFEEYRRGQQAVLIRGDALAHAEERLLDADIASDDKHIIELALASDAVVLCSEDKALNADFLRSDLLPRVGRRPRVLYPLSAPPEERRAFLRAHDCPNRGTDTP